MVCLIKEENKQIIILQINKVTCGNIEKCGIVRNKNILANIRCKFMLTSNNIELADD